MRLISISCSLLALSILGCHDDGHDHGNENEVITTVTLDFAPMGGGTALSASFDDPDGDGGAAPTIDPIALANGTTYTATVRFLNGLEDPPEEITDEVRDEGQEHQVFFTGTAVSGPATSQTSAPLAHTYEDMDENGLPIGLSNRFVATTGTGQLTVTLRHMPPNGSNEVKTADAAAAVKSGGFTALGGTTDVSVSFMVTVQ